MTRAVSGLAGLAIQRASSNRPLLSWFGSSGLLPLSRHETRLVRRPAGTPRGTIGPSVKRLPRRWTRRLRGTDSFGRHHRDRLLALALRHRKFPPHRRVADFVLKRLGAAEDAGQRVVVGRADSIELVVVTPCAGERQPEQRTAGHVDLIVDDIEPRLLLIGFGQCLRPDHQIAGRDDPPRVGLDRVGRRQQIAGELLDEELVVRQIAIEGVDDVVAIPPGELHHRVGVVRGRLGVAHHVEPMPGPTLAVMRRIEQPVHDPFIRLRRVIAQKCGDLVGRRRESGQIERDSPQQRQLVGRWSGTRGP